MPRKPASPPAIAPQNSSPSTPLFNPSSQRVNLAIPAKYKVNNLAWLLRSWRSINQLTGAQACELLGIDPSTYSRLERGDGLTFPVYFALLQWFHQSPKPEFQPHIANLQRRVYAKEGK